MLSYIEWVLNPSEEDLLGKWKENQNTKMEILDIYSHSSNLVHTLKLYMFDFCNKDLYINLINHYQIKPYWVLHFYLLGQLSAKFDFNFLPPTKVKELV